MKKNLPRFIYKQMSLSVLFYCKWNSGIFFIYLMRVWDWESCNVGKPPSWKSVADGFAQKAQQKKDRRMSLRVVVNLHYFKFIQSLPQNPLFFSTGTRNLLLLLMIEFFLCNLLSQSWPFDVFVQPRGSLGAWLIYLMFTIVVAGFVYCNTSRALLLMLKI